MSIWIQFDDEHFEIEDIFCLDDLFDWLEESGIDYEGDWGGEPSPYTSQIITLFVMDDFTSVKLRWL